MSSTVAVGVLISANAYFNLLAGTLNEAYDLVRGRPDNWCTQAIASKGELRLHTLMNVSILETFYKDWSPLHKIAKSMRRLLDKCRGWNRWGQTTKVASASGTLNKYIFDIQCIVHSFIQNLKQIKYELTKVNPKKRLDRNLPENTVYHKEIEFIDKLVLLLQLVLPSSWLPE